MVERQGIDHRPEAQPLRALRHGSEKDARARRHAERRRMMLGQVVAVEARAIEQLDDREPLLVIVRKRCRAAIEVVEDSEFHRAAR